MQVIKVPGLNNLGKNDGCRNAGNAILDELKKIMDVSALDLGEIHVDNNKVDEQLKLIYENSKKIFQSQDSQNKVVFLGGDHSISYPLCKAFMESYGKENSYLIVFDAHPDTMPSMKEPTHEEWLRKLIEDGFSPSQIILVGLRKIDLEERQFLDSQNITHWEMGKFSDMEILCDSLMEFVNKPNASFYLSLDIDAVDPAFAPSTGYLEPGGFTSREILYFIQRITMLKNLKALDIVEIDSEKDQEKNNSITIKLGARILKEAIK